MKNDRFLIGIVGGILLLVIVAVIVVLMRGQMEEYRPAVELEMMRRIKAALDPRGILNPGKVV